MLIVLFSLVAGIGSQFLVNSKLKKYSRFENEIGLTGAQMAQKMLNDHGISNVAINQGQEGQDHFDPRSNSISLSPSVYGGNSITAMATACHEVGHAIQYATNYAPMKVRGSLVPVANFASNAWIFLFVLGLIMQMNGLTLAAAMIYMAVLLFEVVTLPVEFNASKRALSYIGGLGISNSEDMRGSKQVLFACALTYVVAALASALQLLWILASSNDGE